MNCRAQNLCHSLAACTLRDVDNGGSRCQEPGSTCRIRGEGRKKRKRERDGGRRRKRGDGAGRGREEMGQEEEEVFHFAFKAIFSEDSQFKVSSQ